jgi:hypothetical protein
MYDQEVEAKYDFAKLFITPCGRWVHRHSGADRVRRTLTSKTANRFFFGFCTNTKNLLAFYLNIFTTMPLEYKTNH